MKLSRRTVLGVAGSVAVGVTARAGQDPLPAMPDPSLPAPLPDEIPLAPPPPMGSNVRGRMTGANAAVRALLLECTPCVFGVPGAQNNEFWDAMKTHGMPYMLVTNEYSASIMADAASRVTGRVGTFAVVPGPGITNALTGVGEALYDSVPIVGIVTDISRQPGAPIGQVHGLPNAALLRPVCKAVYEVRHAAQIPGAIHQAFCVAKSGEPGPAAVVIPYDCYTQVWDYDEPIPTGPPPMLDEVAYQRALRVLSDRRCRVGIYAGLGCMDAGPQLAAVAEMLQAPVATSVSGKGAIPESHPLAVGWGYGKQGTRTAEKTFAKDVDTVLAVGVRYSENSTANYAIPAHAKLIHVDANRNNLGKNVRTDVCVEADSGVFLSRLLGDADCLQRPANPKLVQRIAGLKKVDRCNYETPATCSAVDPAYFLAMLRQAMGCDGLVFVDVTASVHWAAEAYEVGGPRRFFTPANNQSMGWTIPAAVAAQRVALDRRVAAVVGDGSFLMTGLEASTASRMALPVKFFVLEDGAYHYMQMIQEPTFRRTTATEITELDHGAMARALRMSFNAIGANDDVPTGIRRALAAPGPVLTSVRITYGSREIRWLETLKGQYIEGLDRGERLRMASRVAKRTVTTPFQEND
jgi:acetolactate synthase-1/2/3 large subunit